MVVEMSLICHVTSQDYVIKGSRDLTSGNSSLYVNTLPSLVAIGTMVVEMFLISCVISLDHMIKRPCDITGRSLSR